jgi:serine/threonine-protein kinase
MSPEQARGDLEHLGPRSDIYSLGATLSCLLTGEPPLEGDDIGELLRKAQRGEFPRPRHTDPSIDKALEAVCLKAMALKPEDRYDTPRLLAEEVERWMADEPVTAWSEPWSRTLLRWLTRHRVGVTAAAGLVALVGLASVAATQARGRAALEIKNRDLADANAKVQARYDLAVNAIKTFHTGVSEDFLLKQDQFHELRDRLLKSAADFYGKLGALLGRETDVTSRRALAASNFELADLTDQVGRTEDALAAHRAVLAAREALAAGPGVDDDAKVDVGRSLTEVASLLAATGKAEEVLAAPPIGVAAGGPAWDRHSGTGRAGGLPHADGPAPVQCRRGRRGAGGLEAGAGRPGGAGRDPRGLGRRPPRPGDHRRRTRLPAVADGQSAGRRGRDPLGAGDPAETGGCEPHRGRFPQQPGD